ncbi:MAG: HDOD domain-containing protein [Calditrichaeota bacterium]|nr:MAG: HDOD domain-containing protein [Calditrichota bacterium]
MGPNIIEIIEQVEDFPAMPHAVIQLFRMANQEDISLANIARLISQDPSLSSRILKMVNSNYYNFQQTVTNINQAVSFLGLKTIRDVAVTVSMMNIFPGTHQEMYKKLFLRSLCAGVTSSLIVDFAGKGDKSEAFLAALLQNIGQFIYLRYMTKQYIAVIEEAVQNGIELPFIEKLRLRITNAQAGQIVAERWNLPHKVIMAIRYQYNIQLAYKKALPKETLQIIELAYLGGLAADFFTGYNKNFKWALFRTRLEKLFGKGRSASDDILSSIPPLINNMGFCSLVGEIDSYEKNIKKAELELIHSYSTFNKTYHALNQLKQKKLAEELLSANPN